MRITEEKTTDKLTTEEFDEAFDNAELGLTDICTGETSDLTLPNHLRSSLLAIRLPEGIAKSLNKLADTQGVERNLLVQRWIVEKLQS